MPERRSYRYDAAREARAQRFASELSDALHKLGISHKHLARDLGVTVYAVDSWTRGTDPAVPGEANRHKLCALLESYRPGVGRQVLDAADHKWEWSKAALAPAPALPIHQPVSLPMPDAREAPSSNLPLHLTSFIGREREISEVEALLGSIRLLTLTGAGGIGKTRLALQVAADSLQLFPDGVWLVEMAPIADPSVVPSTVAYTLGMRDASGHTTTESLSIHLRKKHLLLVLDNCEHVIDACAALTDDLLRACPGLTIMATSREALRIDGETLWRVPPLSLRPPQPGSYDEQLLECEACRLFMERARALRIEFQLTPQNTPAALEICRKLDGVPLAIELAAACTGFLSVEQIAARLDDSFRLLTGGHRTVLPRHRTLRAAIDWSYDLLSQDEKTLFNRLSIFTGGWTLEAAEVVCSDSSMAKSIILTLLRHLVDKSLVVVEETGVAVRYRMLETIRQYASERHSEGSDVEGLRQRHACYYTEWAEAAEKEIFGPRQVEILERLDDDHGNFRLALEWHLRNDAQPGLQLASALTWYWHLKGHLAEGQGWLQAFLAQSKDQEPTRPLARALCAEGRLVWQQGEFANAWPLFEKSASLCRQLGDDRTLVYALSISAYLAVPLGRGTRAEALALVEEGADIARKVGDKWGLSIALSGKAHIVMDQDDYANAEILYREALALRRALGVRWGIAGSLNNLGEVVRLQDDYVQAEKLYEESLAMERELGNRWGIAIELANLGYVANHNGDYEAAARFFSESLALHHEQGTKEGIMQVLAGFAQAAAGEGRAERAACLFGATHGLQVSTGAGLVPADRPMYDSALAELRATMDKDAFDASWEAGQTMGLDDMIAYALE